jgi:hypothetical protein
LGEINARDKEEHLRTYFHGLRQALLHNCNCI